MTKAQYQQECLKRSPAFQKELAELAQLNGRAHAAKAKAIQQRFHVDPSAVLSNRDNLGARPERLRRPKYLGAPGVFYTYPGSRLRDRMVGHDRRKDMFDWARLWIPIYADTTSADLDWAEINAQQQKLYGPKRVRASQFEQRLQAWEHLTKGIPGGTKGLQKKLKISTERTARRVLAQAWTDIMASDFPGLRKAKQQATQAAAGHLSMCRECQAGNMCDEGNRLLDLEAGVKGSY